MWCYPVQFALPAPRPPLVEHFLDRDQALLRYLGDTQVLNAAYLQKLVSRPLLIRTPKSEHVIDV